MVDLITITEPASEPVTVGEAKTHLRVGHSNDDTYIGGLIAVARKVVETRTGFRLISQVTELRADSFFDPGLASNKSLRANSFALGNQRRGNLGSRGSNLFFNEVINLKVAPVITVDSVKFDDPNDVEQTVPANDYYIDIESKPARIQIKNNSSWPTTQDKIAAVRIRMTTGYATAALVPEHFKLVMKLLLTHYYFNRTAVDEINFHDVPEGIDIILLNQEYHFWQTY